MQKMCVALLPHLIASPPRTPPPPPSLSLTPVMYVQPISSSVTSPSSFKRGRLLLMGCPL